MVDLPIRSELASADPGKLTAGETVVTEGQLRLVPGTRISVKSAEAAEKAR